MTKFRNIYTRFFVSICVLFVMTATDIRAEDGFMVCDSKNRGCVLNHLRHSALKIDNKSWRDRTLRDLAKTYAADGEIDQAISVIQDIGSSDTKAMTIRGIGMAVADLPYDKSQEDSVFTKLRNQAEKIQDPPSYAIALTYIAMGQAFAGNNDGAWATAADMENAALRNKAYGETAEIQAENGDFEAAMKSIGFIESEAFQNKAYTIISKLFADRYDFQSAYNATLYITNAYKQSEALQYLLDKQTEERREQLKTESATP